PRPPPCRSLLRRGAAHALGLAALLLTEDDDEMLGVAVEAGTGLMLGTVPAVDEDHAHTARMSDPAAIVDPVRELWNRLGISPDLLPRAVVTTPVCGLAGASPAHARQALTTARAGARV